MLVVHFTLVLSACFLSMAVATRPNVPEYPFMAAIESRHGGTKQQICSGTIIEPKFVITAAHCLRADKSNGEQLFVKAGVIDAFLPEQPQYLQTLKVKSIYVHPSYDGSDQSPFDVAILQLDGNIKFNRHVNPIALARATQPPPKGTAVSIGFMSQKPQDSGAKADSVGDLLTIVSNDDCKKTYPALANSQICLDVKYPSCDRDSGGAIVQSIGFMPTIVGIHSYRKTQCGSEPEIAVRISSFMDDFIMPTVKANRG